MCVNRGISLGAATTLGVVQVAAFAGLRSFADSWHRRRHVRATSSLLHAEPASAIKQLDRFAPSFRPIWRIHALAATCVLADRPFAGLERLHDACLVRSSEIYRPAVVARHPGELGHRVNRVLLCSARQPDWPYRLFDG